VLVPVLLIAILVLAFGGRPLRRAFAGVGKVWRPTTGLVSVTLMVGAAVLAVREDWAFALLFALLAAGLALSARFRRTRRTVPAASGMSRREAGAILGVAEDAPPDVVEAAYRRLMGLVHPDRGGAPGLAAQLNAARAVFRAR
jgi:hypothetical protein